MIIALGIAAALSYCASAAAIPLVRAWEAVEIEAGSDPLTFDVGVAPTADGGSVATYRASTGGGVAIRAAVRPAGAASFGPPQTLATSGFYPTLDGSVAGGAVVAWIGGGRLRVAELRSGVTSFTEVVDAASSSADYSYDHPRVDVGVTGAAAVLYLAAGPASTHQLMAVTRPAGGTFGAPEPIGSARARNEVRPTDVAVGPGGAVVAGMVVDGQAAVAIRAPGGGWTAPEALGPTTRWGSPLVGVDSAGNVAAAWLRDPGAGAEVGPVLISFRDPGGPFGAPRDTGLTASIYGAGVDFAVSGPGEAALVAEVSHDNPNGGTQLDGLKGLYALTAHDVVGAPAPLTAGWSAGTPQLGMNGRGDAFIAWGDCCPMVLQGRRREPLGSFGPIVDVAPPITFSGVRGGRWPLDAAVDEFGNARAAWVDSEPNPVQLFAGVDLPALTQPLPPVPASGPVPPPFLPGYPALPPGLEPQPVDPAVDPALEVRLRVKRRPAGRRLAVVAECSLDCRVRASGQIGKRVQLKTASGRLRAGKGERLLLAAKADSNAVREAAKRGKMATVTLVAKGGGEETAIRTRKRMRDG